MQRTRLRFQPGDSLANATWAPAGSTGVTAASAETTAAGSASLGTSAGPGGQHEARRGALELPHAQEGLQGQAGEKEGGKTEAQEDKELARLRAGAEVIDCRSEWGAVGRGVRPG